jgi:hypothetical protein
LLEVEGCQRKDLSCGCSNYFELPVKKKKQVDMGVRNYGCIKMPDDLRKMFYDKSLTLQSVGPKKHSVEENALLDITPSTLSSLNRNNSTKQKKSNTGSNDWKYIRFLQFQNDALNSMCRSFSLLF